MYNVTRVNVETAISLANNHNSNGMVVIHLTVLNVHVFQVQFNMSKTHKKERKKEREQQVVDQLVLLYLSLRMTLFSFFHCSLKSEENSCQMQKTVLGVTSLSPALAFTEKNTVSSRNLTGHKQKLP